MFCVLGFGVWGLGFGAGGLGFGVLVWGLRFRLEVGYMVSGFGLRVYGFILWCGFDGVGIRVEGFRLRVWRFGSGV